MRKHWLLITAILFGMLSLSLWGCAPRERTATPGPAPAQEPIRIGVLGAFELAAGKEIRMGAELAIKEINEAGGILGRPIEAFFEDTKARAEQARAATYRLLFQNNVDILVGEHRSEAALAIQSVAAEHQILYLNAGSASPRLSDNVANDFERFKFTFRPSMTSAQLGDGFIGPLQWLMEKYGFDRVAVLAETAIWADPIVERLKTLLGDKIVLLERPSTDAKDFSVELSKIADSKAQIVLTLFSADQGIVFARQWSDRQIPALVTGYSVQAQSSEFWNQTEGKAHGLITWKQGVRTPITEKTIPFYDAFVKAYGRSIGPYTGLKAYDAVWLLKEAIEMTGDFDSGKVVETLRNNTFSRAGGKIRFNETNDIFVGEGFLPMTSIQWQDGKMQVVWPEEFATAEVILPAWMKR